MSKTKKAVIIGSVLVGIGVIIGFIGIAIGGFKFPNGARLIICRIPGSGQPFARFLYYKQGGHFRWN